MTAQEFEDKQKEILEELPEEFRGAVGYMAWELGHAYGYEEVITYSRDFVSSLTEPIKNYTSRISK